ncbi:hypothetical protein [Paenibacillus woosongensis]|uniref:Uncharacterized protein n=1 Tax=Paenibacillus woosongensis TaxID=307580 RepID=A0ABQ4MPH7_9BACL|nr:hypothetical protein [Paenibacillus woosongensis]GIP57887.1 hypothetical protein J15TS10_17010 [Paenibacillus woosongensis]
MEQIASSLKSKQKALSSGFLEARSKHAVLKPNPHILKDDEKNIELARIDDHHIWIYDDGNCVSQFKVTSLGATPHSPNEAKAVYVFLDSQNKEVGRWDAGTFPCNCGDNQAQRTLKGQYNGNLYDIIMDVEFPVPGDFVRC